MNIKEKKLEELIKPIKKPEEKVTDKFLCFVDGPKTAKLLRKKFAKELARCRDEQERIRWECAFDAGVLHAREVFDV